MFCPVLGWVDFDPTNNVQPALEHITLAWGLAGAALAAPAPDQPMDRSLLQRQDLPYRFTSPVASSIVTGDTVTS